MAPILTETAAREIAGGLRITAHIDDGERVPAILLLPSRTPAPAALLIHGYTSHKERMAESVGMALLRRGVASVSIDLPLHGERKGTLDTEVLRNPFEVVRRWRLAVDESRSTIALMLEHRAIDRDRIGLVGYSLGAFLAVATAAAERHVRAVLLAAGGDLPADLPFGPIIRAVVDPPRMVRKLAGRPLLMVNGRLDRTVRRDQAERLFAAASEPKEMRWYGGGHWPPPVEIENACDWMAGQLAGAAREHGVG